MVKPKEKKMTNSSLVTYNPLNPNNSGERTKEIIPHCVNQRSVDKFADKTRKTGCSFAVGFENNTLIVQRFPKGYMSS